MKSEAILLVEDNPSDIDLTKRALGKGCITNELVSRYRKRGRDG